MGNPSKNSPVGYILSLEGADSIISISHLEKHIIMGYVQSVLHILDRVLMLMALILTVDLASKDASS